MRVKTFLKNTLVIVLFVLVCGAPGAVGGQIIYVDRNAPGFNDGSSWSRAYNYLQDALAAASSGDEIRVADGIYRPDEDAIHPNGTGDRTAIFLLTNGVAVCGGYQGYIYTPPPPPPISLSNARRATAQGNEREAAIQPGIATATNASLNESDPNARDIELYETILSGDLAENDIEVDPGDLLTETTRAENSYWVSGVVSTNESTVIDGFTITGGNANNPEEGYIFGGGMATSGDTTTISNCTFTRNSAYFGGGMCNFEGTPTISNCTFYWNSAVTGGGMYNFEGTPTIPTISNCTFNCNSADSGGGIYNEDCSNPTIINCIFTGNSANFNGGGVCSRFYTRATLINCTFANNSAGTNGGAIYWDPGPVPPPPNPACTTRWLIITNCILRGNSDSSGSGESAQIYSDLTPTVNYNCIQGLTGAVGGTGNIDADPCFADANNGDYHLKSQAGRWDANSQSWVRDDVTSPCIDAGNPGCPEANEPTPNDNRRNIGAYGGTAEASKSPAYWRSIADMTNDWIVDSNDLRAFCDYWLQTGECIPSDFDRSRSVDSNDFAVFAGRWRQKGPGPGITYQVDECIPIESPLSAAGESEPTRFTVTVEGQYILFEDLITANCCADEIELLMTVEAGLITIYEIEHTPMPPCPCICDYPTTATLGPFDPGTYTFEVYQGEGFIGSTTVTISPAS